jgi:hypothetical protein
MFHRSKHAVVLLVLSAAAFAQSTPITNSYEAYVDNQATVNQCSIGESVVLNGTVHLDYSVTTDSTGVNHFVIQATNNLTGAGQKTSTAYVANDSDNYTSNNDDASADLTVELKSDLQSQGSAPSLALVQGLHIVADATGNITAQIVSNATSCGN